MPIIRPDGEGDYSTATPFPNDGILWDKISESVADEDTTYVSVVNNGDEFLVTLGSLLTNGTIYDASITWRGKDVVGGSCDLRYKTNGTEYHIHSSFGAGYSEQNLMGLTTNPVTGVAWTVAEVNALQVGAARTGFAGGIRITQIYVTVRYAASAVSGTLWMEGTELYYGDGNGYERYFEGADSTENETAGKIGIASAATTLRYADANGDIRAITPDSDTLANDTSGKLGYESGGSNLRWADSNGDVQQAEGMTVPA